MPNRIVREGIISSKRMADLVRRGGWEAEVFYRRLLNRVDDFGRYTADPELLRTDLFPRQLETIREANMERNLAHCRDARLVRLYEVNGEPYLVLLDFRQRSRASTSKFPQPPDGIDNDGGHVTDTRPSPDGHPPPYSETEAEAETKTKPPVVPPANDELPGFSEFLSLYPKSRRADPKGCRKKWVSMNLESIAPEIISGLKLHLTCEQWKKKFIPLMMTFINQSRWETVPDQGEGDDIVVCRDMPREEYERLAKQAGVIK